MNEWNAIILSVTFTTLLTLAYYSLRKIYLNYTYTYLSHTKRVHKKTGYVQTLQMDVHDINGPTIWVSIDNGGVRTQ